MNALRLRDKYEHVRCEYQTDEWEALKSDGWRTVHVSDDGVAMMRRERRWNDDTDTPEPSI